MSDNVDGYCQFCVRAGILTDREQLTCTTADIEDGTQSWITIDQIESECVPLPIERRSEPDFALVIREYDPPPPLLSLLMTYLKEGRVRRKMLRV